jgi:tetraacyldisaccharide 4'-kinase
MILIKKTIESLLLRIWYGQSQLAVLFAALLSPLSSLYHIVAENNQRKAIAKREDNLPIKIIVIGNITAGGTGKTPLLIALAQQLAAQGWKPAVISRGHGGLYLKGNKKRSLNENNKDKAMPTWVKPESDPFWVGDEPVHIAQALQTMPVIVCPRRIDAVNMLVQQTDCDIILSDDGLQHYALARDIELVLVDSARGFGNQRLLPAGPLREPLERLNSVDMVVFNGDPSSELQDLVAEHTKNNQQAQYSMQMAITGLRSLSDSSIQSADLNYLNRYQVIHLVAGIGNPERFFNAVRLLLSKNDNAPRIVEHAFPDHYSYKESDLVFKKSDLVFAAADNTLSGHSENSSESLFTKSAAIVMTAKDAVKCGGFKQNSLPLYAIDVNAKIDSQMTAAICAQLAQ